MLATSDGRAVRFPESSVRAVGRAGMGVRGVNVGEGNKVVGFVAVDPDDSGDIFALSQSGFGKRTAISEYPVNSRGCKGVKTIKITDKTGELVAIDIMTDDDDLMLINKSGITIRIKATDIKTTSRNTQGLSLINLSRKNDKIASGTIVPHMDDEEAEAEGITSQTPDPQTQQAAPESGPEDGDSTQE